MSNHYRGTNPPLTDVRALHGRGNVFHDLDDHIKERRSVVVMGVEGVGKSSLLNCCFSLDYCRRLAREQHRLIRVTDFPTDLDADGVYQYLAEGVLSAVDALDQEETAAVCEKLRKKCAQKMSENQNAASRFQQVCDVIQNEGYFIVLVIDGFERFVSSPTVRMDHHNVMNNLIAKNLAFVVATNFDFNQDSLPSSVSGSSLLAKFSQNEIPLKGLSEEDCAQLLHPGDFSEEERHQLWVLSGGIPAILRRAAEHTYERKQNGPVVWSQVFEDTYADVSPLLARWCKLLSANQARVLKALADASSKTGGKFEDGALIIAAEELIRRGLLANPVDAETRQAIPDFYKFNTPLLRRWCREHDLPAAGVPSASEPDEGRIREWAEQKGYVLLSRGDTLSKLGEYHLSGEAFSRFDQSVQRFIQDGIAYDQLLLQAGQAGEEFSDYSPQFLMFAKALEAHINHTLLPILKLVDPGYVIRRTPLSDLGHIMLGEFGTLLGWRYRVGSFTDRAGDFCVSRGMGKFQKTWWEGLKNKASGVPEIRNGMAHPDFVPAEKGEALLHTMFFGEKSLFSRCQDLRDEAVRQGLISE